jgi:hypothetical protein
MQLNKSTYRFVAFLKLAVEKRIEEKPIAMRVLDLQRVPQLTTSSRHTAQEMR